MDNKSWFNKTSNTIYLTAASGIFLDIIRLMAALDVAFTHARAIWFRSREFDLVPSHLAHGSVIIFFVLSGYVIAYTTTVKKRAAKEYAVARLARLYSGLFPALLFTAAASLILLYADPGLLNYYSRDKNLLRYTASLFFCNEVWFLSAAPLINGVIWSLSYEFWFYVIFGCWLFRHQKGWLLLFIVIMIAGPKILIMLPIWLLGVFAYKLPKPQLNSITRLMLIALLLAASVLIMIELPQLPYALNASRLYWASSFLSDYAVAICIAFAFWLLPLTGLTAAGKKGRSGWFRKIANLTFPLYVFHYPCLVLCRAFIHNDTYAGATIALLITIAFCFVVGVYVEKWHKLLPQFFEGMFNGKLMRSFVYIKNKMVTGS